MTSEECDEQMRSIPEAADLKPSWHKIRVPEGAVCPKCHSDQISPLPTFSNGSGIAQRPYENDIICRHCSYIGLL